MVSGKILGLSASLVVLVIAVAIVIRFGSNLKIGERFNEGLLGAGNSITSFFDSLLPSAAAQTQSVEPLDLSQPDSGLPNPADAPTNPTPVDIILNDPSKAIEQKKKEVFDRIPSDQKKGTDGFDRVFREDGGEKFNPPNTIAFGDSKINDGKGVPDTPTNRRLVNDILSGQVFVGGTAFEGVDSNTGLFTDLSQLLPSVPVAFAEEIPKIQGPIQPPSQKELDSRVSIGAFARSQDPVSASDTKKSKPNLLPQRFSLDTFAKQVLGNQPQTKSSNVKGETKGVKITGRGGTGNFVIRPTAVDRSKLLLDSAKRPIETASQRANRVFNEKNEFVDASRGATKLSKTKNANKNFGTNSGSGQKGSTPADTADSRTSALQRAADRARRSFDSRSITNF